MDHIKELSSEYPKPLNYIPTYGTAGYRTDGSLLESTVFRCGILMAIKSLHEGSSCGIMITASHNPVQDNGVKLINCNGEMIDEKWEHYADLLTKSNTSDELINNINLISIENPPIVDTCPVIIGYDNRPSRYMLLNACKKGIISCGAEVCDIGQVTTPELQFYVYLSHKGEFYNRKTNAYILNLVSCFNNLIKSSHKTTHLHIDCANGIGAKKLQILQPLIEKFGLILNLYNTNGILNHLCGADYVEKELVFPSSMDHIQDNERCCSIDGDADRIIYFTKKNGKFRLLNGDKITVLIGLFIKDLCFNIPNQTNTLNIGIVQTNYANGASTNYIKKFLDNFKITCAKTGVKYLHHAAKQYDIGIYFESNGHGTVLFKTYKSYNHVLKNI